MFTRVNCPNCIKCLGVGDQHHRRPYRPWPLAGVVALACLLNGFVSSAARTAEPPANPSGPIALPTSPGGWVMTSDNVTLILSIPARAELMYFDTMADKESNRVSLDFKPKDMALCGKHLIVAQKGASILHVLDAETGKEIKEIRVPGEPLDHVAGAPERGPVFVSNARREIYAIDPIKGTAKKTSAVGQFVAVDAKGEFLYTGTQDPIRERLVIRRNGGGVRASVQKTGRHAHIMKYDIRRGDAALVATNGNASINGAMMCLSPDGKRIALPGGGGWESLTARSRSYSIAVWDTKNVETMLGQVEVGAYPRNIAFHPVLNLVAADHNGEKVSVYHGKSLAEVKVFNLNVGPGQYTPSLLTFGGKGSKVIYVSPAAKKERGRPGVNFDENPTQLHFLPLELSDKDKAALEKAYSKR